MPDMGCFGEFPAQRASNAENVSIWWRHHAAIKMKTRQHAWCGCTEPLSASYFYSCNNKVTFLTEKCPHIPVKYISRSHFMLKCVSRQDISVTGTSLSAIKNSTIDYLIFKCLQNSNIQWEINSLLLYEDTCSPISYWSSILIPMKLILYEREIN